MSRIHRALWSPPPVWRVPRLWPNARVFVLCGGESVREQRHLIPSITGPVIAIKEGVHLRPYAEVAFFAGERPDLIAPPCLRVFRGQYIVVRGRGHRVFPSDSKRVLRPANHFAWCDDPTTVAGFDAGTSAINLAMHLGAKEIVLLGYDMTGGRWFNGEMPHFLPNPPESDFQTHMSVLPSLAKDAEAKGIRIVNTSPISRATAFEFGRLEDWL